MIIYLLFNRETIMNTEFSGKSLSQKFVLNDRLYVSVVEQDMLGNPFPNPEDSKILVWWIILRLKSATPPESGIIFAILFSTNL